MKQLFMLLLVAAYEYVILKYVNPNKRNSHNGYGKHKRAQRKYE